MQPHLTRRAFALSGLLAVTAGSLHAADSPRPLRLIVPTPPGSAADALARAMTAPWSRASGRAIVVENIVGAGTTIGTSQLLRAAKDGLTLGVVSSNHTINPWLYKKLPYDAIADITPIAMVGNLPAMLVVANSVPAATVAELTRYARSLKLPLNEGVVSGTAYQMASEVFKDQAGLTTNRVPYKGSAQIINDLLGGTLELGFVPAQAVAPHVNAGKLKAVAVTTARRTDVAPNVPTLVESGLKNYDVEIWLAIIGPAGLNSADVLARRMEVEHVLTDPDMRRALQQQGIQLISMGAGEMLQFMKNDLERNRGVIQRVGITID